MKSFFGALFGPAAPAEMKMTSRELEQLLRGGVDSRSGAVVNWQTALQVTTMLACTRVIADGIAQVPWKVYQGEAGRVEANDHPLADLLYRRPNPWQTSFEFRETLAFHVPC
jgi:phage portal protein BeeE